jgi:branched-chain amino acid transport system ATP-binding protein
VLQVIRRLKAEGIGVLVVEQNPLAALGVSDRVYVMDKGRIVHQGGAADLLRDAQARMRLLGA